MIAAFIAGVLAGAAAGALACLSMAMWGLAWTLRGVAWNAQKLAAEKKARIPAGLRITDHDGNAAIEVPVEDPAFHELIHLVTEKVNRIRDRARVHRAAVGERG